MKYKCKCCGYYTLTEKPVDPEKHPGTFEICPVCYWEDDSLQYLHSGRNFGANGISLNDAKKNFKRFGAVREDMIKYVRAPLPEEIIDNTEI